MSRKLVVAGLFALILGAVAVPSMADPGRGANILYSYNAVGRSPANTVTRTAVGTYNVTCKGVGGGSLFPGSGTWGPGGHHGQGRVHPQDQSF